MVISETTIGRPKNVCVIGAGPAGLVTARELKRGGGLNVVVLEKNHDIGGQWLYEPNVENEHPLGNYTNHEITINPSKVHSSIYDSLRLNIPREVIGFTDFPFVVNEGRDSRRFPGHHEVYLYLRDFCDRFQLWPVIRFGSRVEYVGMADRYRVEKEPRWVVRSREKDGKVVEEVFDAVVVATGQYSHPRVPSIKGMDSWCGKQIHSHVYRVPEPFRNEVVVVVGCSASGLDISMELLGVAKKVCLSAKSTDRIIEGLTKLIPKNPNLHICPQIESLGEDGRVSFVDGSSVIADTILYCTGYSYAFPFLDTNGIVTVDDDRVGPLYEHTFPPSLAPSLSFVGIPRKVITLPFFELQGKWIAQLLAGKTTLPSFDEMTKAVEEFYVSKDAAGIPKHKTHDLNFSDYPDKYADKAGFPRLEEWRNRLCLSTLSRAFSDLETFRDSKEGDEELLLEALRSPHFTKLGPLDLTRKAYGLA